MKFFSLYLVFIITILHGQVETLWETTYGGGNNEFGGSVQQTNDGKIIIVGGTESYGNGQGDIWLVKTESNGDLLWSKTIGSGDHEVGNQVRQTQDAGYIILGLKKDSANWAFDSDIWLVKTDSNGDSLWSKTFGGIEEENCNSIYETTDGGYIIGGTTRSFGSGQDDIWLIKTDSNGDSLWSKTFGGPNSESCGSIQQTTDGGYIIGGTTRSFGSGHDDMWLIKTTSNGDSLWTRTIGSSEPDRCYYVIESDDGGYVLTGEKANIIEGSMQSHLSTLKFNQNGEQIWDMNYNPTGRFRGDMLEQTQDGGFIILGTQFMGWFQMKLLIKTNDEGTEQWSQQIGSATSFIQETNDGGFIATGTALSPSGGEPTDMMLMKIGYVESSVWHVSSTGSDSTGDGSEENPLASIQAGIDAASNGDTVFVAPGIYFENIIWPLINGIKLIGVGEESCIIDGDSTGRVISFVDSLNGVIDTSTLVTGFTIQNGYSDPENSVETPGGGIYCYNSSPLFTDCTIKENFAYGDGGGIFLSDSSNAVFLNVKIENNIARGRLMPGFPPTRYKGKGGGVCIYNSDPIFTGTDIINNYAGYNGSGAYILYSSPIFSDFTISGNGGSGYLQKGGGVSCEGAPNAIFIGGEISDNGKTDIGVAPYIGGGIHVGLPVMDTLSNFHVELIDVIVQNNASRMWGGGISGKNISLAGCTIKGNISDHGGGIFADGLIEFSETNRCNIYSNTIEDSSQNGNEIAIALDSDSIAVSFLNVVLDTFTVSTPTELYATPVSSFTFDILVGLDNLDTELDIYPLEFSLYPNYPNPFNPITTLHYYIPNDADVNITVYDMVGRVVKTLVNKRQSSGFKSISWDATNDAGSVVSAGVYLYMVNAGDLIKTNKMVLLK